MNLCTLRDELTERYTSDQFGQIYIYGGLAINPNRKDFYYVDRAKYSCPDRIGYAREDGTYFLVSGSDSRFFKAQQLGIWAVLNNKN